MLGILCSFSSIIMISVALNSSDSNSSFGNVSDTSSGNSSLVPNTLEIVKRESFNDWQQWKDRYPSCNLKNNPNLSPIKIEEQSIAKNKENDMRAIFVHSKVPVDDCLSLSLLYKDGDFEMEAVTLNALPGCSEQLTYISGGGQKPISMRYFKRALFFFTTTQPEGERSLHLVKGKQFQMEIMIEFVALNTKDYTQIFILVETSPSETRPANPIFTALEPALKALEQEVTSEASGKTARALKYKKLQEDCSLNKEKYLKAQEETKDVFDRFKSVKTLIRKINRITNQDLEKLKSSNISIENSGNFSSSSSNETEAENVGPLELKLEKLKSERSNLVTLMDQETEDWAFDKMQILYSRLESIINKMEYSKNTGKDWNAYKLEKIRNKLKANKVGMPGESSFPDMLYENPDAVHKEFSDLQSKINEYKEAEELYNTSCQAFFEFQMEPYAFVKINQPFQISWLFPQSGGYYLYEGSSPLPDCQQRDTTIVFEEPLLITTEQLSTFQSLPSLETFQDQDGVSSNTNSNRKREANVSHQSNGGSKKVDKMIPIIFNSDKSRKVWYTNKNPVFLEDDGFHKRSAKIKQSSSGEASFVIIITIRMFSLYAFMAGLHVLNIISLVMN